MLFEGRQDEIAHAVLSRRISNWPEESVRTTFTVDRVLFRGEGDVPATVPAFPYGEPDELEPIECSA